MMAGGSGSARQSWGERLGAAAARFVAAPASPRPLAAVRIGISLTLLLQALALAGSVLALFGPRAVVQWSLTDTLVLPGVPRLSWFTRLFAPLGVSEEMVVRGCFVLYVAGLSALLFGWHTRVAAVVAWFTHLLVMMGHRSSLYGVDDFAHIVLFYFMWMPVGHAWSLDVASGWVKGAPSFAARLSLRVLQLHLCIVYLSSGIEKLMAPGAQWISGEVLWKALMLPEFAQFDVTWLADYPWFLRLATWGSLALELGYAFFIWPRLTRVPTALATIGMHLGIAVLMGMVSFGCVMMVLTGGVWLVPAEPEAP
jgi:hypothetical protein